MIVAEQEGQTRRRYRERDDERRLVLPAERRQERKKRQPGSEDDRNRNSAREPCGDPTGIDGIDGNDAGAKEENRNKQKRPEVAAVWRRLQADPLQYPRALRDRAIALGWPAQRVHIIDQDLGMSGAHSVARDGFQELVAAVGLRKVGQIIKQHFETGPEQILPAFAQMIE